MTRILKTLAALVAACGLALPACAGTTFSTDYTDLWWAGSAENGWGVNMIQQGDTIFATLFVYGSDNTARWYVASGATSTGANTFSGPLYRTTGPYFGTAYVAALFGFTQVGAFTAAFSGPNSGTITYSVDGVPVTKSVTRQTWRSNTLTGTYLGGLTARCSAGGNVLIFDTLNVAQSGSNVTMTVDFFNASGVQSRCVFSGAYTAQGRIGAIGGTFNCTYGASAGNSGSFSMSNVDAGVNGFNSSFTGSDQFCSYNGYFGGLKDVL